MGLAIYAAVSTGLLILICAVLVGFVYGLSETRKATNASIAAVLVFLAMFGPSLVGALWIKLACRPRWQEHVAPVMQAQGYGVANRSDYMSDFQIVRNALRDVLDERYAFVEIEVAKGPEARVQHLNSLGRLSASQLAVARETAGPTFIRIYKGSLEGTSCVASDGTRGAVSGEYSADGANPLGDGKCIGVIAVREPHSTVRVEYSERWRFGAKEWTIAMIDRRDGRQLAAFSRYEGIIRISFYPIFTFKRLACPSHGLDTLRDPASTYHKVF